LLTGDVAGTDEQGLDLDGMLDTVDRRPKQLARLACKEEAT
jgi:hypothetical protein